MKELISKIILAVKLYIRTRHLLDRLTVELDCVNFSVRLYKLREFRFYNNTDLIFAIELLDLYNLWCLGGFFLSACLYALCLKKEYY